MGIRREEEMEMSDDENCDSPTKKMRVDESGNAGVPSVGCRGEPPRAGRGRHVAVMPNSLYLSCPKRSSLSDAALESQNVNPVLGSTAGAGPRGPLPVPTPPPVPEDGSRHERSVRAVPRARGWFGPQRSFPASEPACRRVRLWAGNLGSP